MANILRDEGYVTQAVGKWHLGFCNAKYLPTNRGFDHHFGFWLGAQNYYTHIRDHGYDLRNDLAIANNDNNTYSSELFAERASSIISQHRRNTNPLFLYVAFQAVHTPLQVPENYEKIYKRVKNIKRRKFLGMVTAMDDAVGRIIKALEENHMLQNTMIVFLSDNGGPIDQGADNYPLRGSKGSLWEGGSRTPAFIFWQKLRPRIEQRMFHITDWFPTFLDMIGSRHKSDELDGVSHKKALMGADGAWERRDMLYNAFRRNKAAMRVGDWKLILPHKQLFNIVNDPTESKNIAKENKSVVRDIESKLVNYTRNLSRVKYPQKNPKGHPRNWKGVWSYGWC